MIAPVQCEYLALEGLTQLLHTLSRVRQALNPRLANLYLLMTMFDARTGLSQGVVGEVRRHFPRLFLGTIIPRTVRLGEAPSYGQSILRYDSAGGPTPPTGPWRKRWTGASPGGRLVPPRRAAQRGPRPGPRRPDRAPPEGPESPPPGAPGPRRPRGPPGARPPDGTLLEVELGRIEPNPRQPRRRMEEAELGELANSIREHGLLSPWWSPPSRPAARGAPRYRLVAGERRWQAAKIAGLVRAPVVVREVTPRELLELALVENVQREVLNPLEMARPPTSSWPRSSA